MIGFIFVVGLCIVAGSFLLKASGPDAMMTILSQHLLELCTDMEPDFRAAPGISCPCCHLQSVWICDLVYGSACFVRRSVPARKKEESPSLLERMR